MTPRFLIGGKKGVVETVSSRDAFGPPCAIWGVLNGQDLKWRFNIDARDHPFFHRAKVCSEHLPLRVRDGEPLAATLTAELLLDAPDGHKTGIVFLEDEPMRMGIVNGKTTLIAQSAFHTDLILTGEAQLPDQLAVDGSCPISAGLFVDVHVRLRFHGIHVGRGSVDYVRYLWPFEKWDLSGIWCQPRLAAWKGT